MFIYIIVYQMRFLYEDYFFIIRSSVLSLSLMFFLRKTSKTSLIYILLLIPFLFRGEYFNVLPTFLRLTIFILFAFNSFNLKSKHLSDIFNLILIFSVASALFQIFSGNLVWKTSAYRLSGFYGDNVTGFSLLLTQLFLIYNGRKINLCFNLPPWSINLFLVSMILMTQSRLAIAVIVLYFLLKLLKGLKLNLVKLIRVGFIIAIYASITIYIIDNSSLLDRVTDTFKYSFQDASTRSRIVAWGAVMSSMSQIETFFGIGLGQFHIRYYELTGFKGMDAHMDWIKLYSEGGVYLLLVWIILTLNILYKTKKKTLGSVDNFTALFIILNIMFFSSLHNVFYYTLTPIIGLLFINNTSKNNDEKKFINSSCKGGK